MSPHDARSDGEVNRAPERGADLRKDWITLLVSTSGVLLAVIAGVIGVYHSAVSGFCWLIIPVDSAALITMGCFMRAAQLGLDALGTLILASRQPTFPAGGPDPNQRVRQVADRADRWFRRGLSMAVATAVIAVVALNVIAALD